LENLKLPKRKIVQQILCKPMHDKIVKLVDKMLELNKKKNSLPPSSERERIEREIKECSDLTC